MRKEKSCGVIPFYLDGKNIKVVLIKQNNGVIGFPKGHVEGNEDEIDTALRECKEEVNILPSIIDGFREEISYYISTLDVYKTVVFFVGVIKDLTFVKQESEISDVILVDVTSALDLISYNDTKELFRKAYNYLLSNI